MSIWRAYNIVVVLVAIAAIIIQHPALLGFCAGYALVVAFLITTKHIK